MTILAIQFFLILNFYIFITLFFVTDYDFFFLKGEIL